MLVRSVVFSAQPGPRQREIQSTALPDLDTAPADTVEPPEEEEEGEGLPDGRGAGTVVKSRPHSRRLTPASKLQDREKEE